MVCRERRASFMLVFLSLIWFSAQAVDIPEEGQQQATGQEVKTLTDLHKAIVVHSASPTFTIRLAANASTGYQWFLTDYNPRLVKLLDQQYVANPTKLAGSPGISVWEFQLQQTAFVAPQLTHVAFEYRRSWEPKSIKHQTFTIVSGK